MKPKNKLWIAGSVVAAMVMLGGTFPQPYANAAAADSTSAQSQNTVKPERGRLDKPGFYGLQEQLLPYLNLDEAAFREKIASQTLAEIAESQGIARADLKAKLVEWLESKLTEADVKQREAKQGEDKQGEANSKLKTRTMDASAMAEKWLDATGQSKGTGLHRGGMLAESEELAGALGVTSDELKEALKSGQTLADIAATHNVDLAAITDLLVEKQKELLAKLLEDGKLTQDEYTTRMGEITDRITKMVNGD